MGHAQHAAAHAVTKLPRELIHHHLSYFSCVKSTRCIRPLTTPVPLYPIEIRIIARTSVSASPLFFYGRGLSWIVHCRHRFNVICSGEPVGRGIATINTNQL
jgi:hypothetical protein